MHDHYRNRIGGDNGISKYLSTLNNGLDVWFQKVSTQILNENGKSKTKITEAEWLNFYQAIDELVDCTSKIEQCVGYPLKDFIELSSMPDEFKRPKM